MAEVWEIVQSNSVLKWLVIYIITLVGFSQGATVLMQLTPTSRAPEEYVDEDDPYHLQTPFQMFQMLKFFLWVSVGEVQPGVLLNAARSEFLMTAFYFVFVVISTWMLMNLLIGLMSNTFGKEAEKGKQTWWLEFASRVLRYAFFCVEM